MLADDDRKWAAPVHDDRSHSEFLSRQGAQAGLSWRTIRYRREGYRRTFAGFNPQVVAAFDARQIAELLQDTAIIRNRAKLRAALGNARAFLEVPATAGSFDAFLWRCVDGAPKVNSWRTVQAIPAITREAEALSGALKKKKFIFVGQTMMYAHMQACGLVNDRPVECFRYRELTGAEGRPAARTAAALQAPRVC